MENAEEVMQLLEEFSKIRPKDIPKELEDYLGYVAKTGDPVFQWSLVKSLFREKLVSVITDFYETTSTVELPPCPNVEPFNYERMKTSLLERFDNFSSAPFTVQRICELLTNPRKEYNRADKYMRAIEKNVLVVSTREPGSGKRPLECDQTEMVLNGMPDIKMNESDGSFLGVPTDLPYLGAPPASNDVTIETSEPNSTRPMQDRIVLDVNGGSKALKLDSTSDSTWQAQDTATILSTENDEAGSTTSESLTVSDHTFNECTTSPEDKCLEENSCDTNDKLINVENIDPISSFGGESSSEIVTKTHESTLLETGSIDSSDSTQECNNVQIGPSSKGGLEKTENGDENEVSSTPDIIASDRPDSLISEDKEELADSEAEATDISLLQCSKLESNPISEGFAQSSGTNVEQNQSLGLVTITEITEASESDEGKSIENDIASTVISPTSPNSVSSLQENEDQGINLGDQNNFAIVVEECEQPDLHPDSSNDVNLSLKSVTSPVSEKLQSSEYDSEADFVQGSNLDTSESTTKEVTLVVIPPDQSINSTELLEARPIQVSSPDPNLNLDVGTSLNSVTEQEIKDKPIVDDAPSSNSAEESEVSEGNCSNFVEEPKLSITEDANVVAEDIFDHERREESVIQSPSSISTLKEMVTVEDISVDPSCEAEEEAMDVDESSNQMMVSEGENDSEPMEQQQS